MSFVWIMVFVVVGVADFVLDKIPAAASLNQFVEHLILWGIAAIGATYFGNNPSVFVAAIAGSAVQAVRQAYTAAADAATGGVASPPRGIVEDIVAFVGLPLG
jgi:hypothetical protein